MKALFYGGAIASLVGIGMGYGMHLPSNPPGPVADDQAAVYQQVSSEPETVSYAPSYLVDASYAGQPAMTPEPQYPPVYDEPALDQVLDPADAPAAAPQDVAAAGDTTTAPKLVMAPPQTRTYASIDALLSNPPS